MRQRSLTLLNILFLDMDVENHLMEDSSLGKFIQTTHPKNFNHEDNRMRVAGLARILRMNPYDLWKYIFLQICSFRWNELSEEFLIVEEIARCLGLPKEDHSDIEVYLPGRYQYLQGRLVPEGI